jgi:hypothetical protein
MSAVLKTIEEKERCIKLICNNPQKLYQYRHYRIEDNQDIDSTNLYYMTEELAQQAFANKLEQVKKGEQK